ncbi:peptidase dimerization domain-containing protein, partial [uncultured Microbacterium sp.]|uniref:peptidase dimerization domain-containing protein n=1 Tax=uncultured Microbacterium sp. TaxID=191216 RepID=UPI0028E3DA0D
MTGVGAGVVGAGVGSVAGVDAGSASAAAVGAFLAAAPIVARLGGRLSLIGTPAEENGGGKELIIRAGGFDDVDAAGMVHPGAGSGTGSVLGQRTTGVRRVAVTYHGRAAHAAGAPWLGRNALDGVVTAYQGVAQLRQHILPTDRIHGIITDGGAAPNIVPERAAALFYVRSADVDGLRDLTERVVAVLEGAARITGTRAEIDVDPVPPYLPLETNVALTTRCAGVRRAWTRDSRPSRRGAAGRTLDRHGQRQSHRPVDPPLARARGPGRGLSAQRGLRRPDGAPARPRRLDRRRRSARRDRRRLRRRSRPARRRGGRVRRLRRPLPLGGVKLLGFA